MNNLEIIFVTSLKVLDFCLVLLHFHVLMKSGYMFCSGFIVYNISFFVYELSLIGFPYFFREEKSCCRISCSTKQNNEHSAQFS